MKAGIATSSPDHQGRSRHDFPGSSLRLILRITLLKLLQHLLGFGGVSGFLQYLGGFVEGAGRDIRIVKELAGDGILGGSVLPFANSGILLAFSSELVSLRRENVAFENEEFGLQPAIFDDLKRILPTLTPFLYESMLPAVTKAQERARAFVPPERWIHDEVFKCAYDWYAEHHERDCGS